MPPSTIRVWRAFMVDIFRRVWIFHLYQRCDFVHVSLPISNGDIDHAKRRTPDGKSSGVIIPKSLLIEIEAKAGDDVEMLVESGRIVIAPLHAHPRSGCAQDAKRITEAGDDAVVWPEFGNADDDAMRWRNIESRRP